MRGFLIFAAALLAAPAPVLADGHAQETSDIEQAVIDFMSAFDAQDADAMRALLVEGASVTVIEEREGEDRVRAVPLDTLVTSISTSPNDLAEPIWNLRVMDAGPVATVVADYEFLIDGNRSHCGTNIVNLVRVDGAWKIAGIAYSHVTQGCAGAPE